MYIGDPLLFLLIFYFNISINVYGYYYFDSFTL